MAVSSALAKPDDNLGWRIKELTSLMEEQDQVVTDACSVLENASKSLASVRTKFEPVKDNAAALSTTSANAGAISQDLHKLISSSKVHQKVRALGRACVLKHPHEASQRAREQASSDGATQAAC